MMWYRSLEVSKDKQILFVHSRQGWIPEHTISGRKNSYRFIASNGIEIMDVDSNATNYLYFRNERESFGEDEGRQAYREYLERLDKYLPKELFEW